MKKNPVFTFFFLLILSACSNSNREDEPTAVDALYFDYQVSAEEGNDNLTIKAEFRLGDREGDAVSIEPIGQITLDGELLVLDSARRTGFYYETYKPVSSFAGSHELVFTSRDGKERKEMFEFVPLTLTTVLPDTVRQEDLLLELEGKSDRDVLRIVMTDTSAAGDGLNRMDASSGGQVFITAEELGMLAPGPVMLELIRETVTRLGGDEGQGGRLLITYSLRRQFILAE